MCLWVSLLLLVYYYYYPPKEPERRTCVQIVFSACFQKARRSWEGEMEKLKDVLLPGYHCGDLDLCRGPSGTIKSLPWNCPSK